MEYICEVTNYPRLIWQIPKGDSLCPDGITIEEDFDFFTNIRVYEHSAFSPFFFFSGGKQAVLRSSKSQKQMKGDNLIVNLLKRS
jgi:hypothetical protein